jgi:hypothetical protein
MIEEGDGKIHHFNFQRLSAINELYSQLSLEQIKLMKEITEYVEPEEATEVKQNPRSRLQ